MTEYPEPTLGRPAKYRWDLWTDGGEWFLRHDEDFDCTAESFVVLVRRTARARGLSVDVHRVSLKEDTGPYVAGDYVKFSFSQAEKKAS
jgi:hypothetical protein